MIENWVSFIIEQSSNLLDFREEKICETSTFVRNFVAMNQAVEYVQGFS